MSTGSSGVVRITTGTAQSVGRSNTAQDLEALEARELEVEEHEAIGDVGAVLLAMPVLPSA